MKVNPGNCHLLLILVASIEVTAITSSPAETLLGIIIDLELNPLVSKYVYKQSIKKVCVTFKLTPGTKELSLNIIFLPYATK